MSPEPAPAKSTPATGQRQPRIGVLVVAYNAEKTISWVLERIKPETWDRITEVFIFDDSSADQTSQAADEHKRSQRLDKVKVFRNQVNLGYGGNQKRGYRYAIANDFDVVVLLHGDGQYAPEVMDALIDPIARGEADAVFGSRMMIPGAARRGGMPFYKLVGNKILSGFQNLVMGVGLSEYHSGYRVYNVHALKRIPFELNSNDFHFDNEIIVQMFDAGARLREVPIPTYYGDEICHVNGMNYAWNVTRTIMRYRLHRAGLLYSRRFDTRGPGRYTFKRNRYSSHNRILGLLDQVAQGRALKVLDLGCGAGFLAKHVAARGHAVYGIDVYDSVEAREHCQRFHVADIERELGLEPDERFDVVILADVLEHCREPERVLLRVRKHLAPGGRIIASTGNVAHLYLRLSLLAGRFTYTERGLLDRTHTRLFTWESFQEMLQECGFKIAAKVSTPIPFDVVLNGWPRLAEGLCAANALGAHLTPGLLAYQVVVEAEPDARASSELLRDEQIQGAYLEWGQEQGAAKPKG